MADSKGNEGKGGGDGKPADTGAKHTIYVNETAFEVHDQSLSGAQIKALANVPSEYQLFLEQPGDDKQIADANSVKLHSNMKFYTLPPATFG